MWNQCGMSSATEAGSGRGAPGDPRDLREEFWQDVKVPGDRRRFNQVLEKAGRVADFLEFGEVMVNDALVREESCGGHFREEQPDGGRRGEA